MDVSVAYANAKMPAQAPALEPLAGCAWCKRPLSLTGNKKPSRLGVEPCALRLKAAPDIRMLTELLQRSRSQRIEGRYLLVHIILKQRKYSRATHSAVFCKVKAREDFGTVCATRVASAVAAGRIINRKTARSQAGGAVVWGLGQALHEDTLADHAPGRFMNHSFAQHHVPVNADIHDIGVTFADEDNRFVDRSGTYGVGEIGVVGVAVAVCNAVDHAPGRRVRSLPVTPDKAMTS